MVFFACVHSGEYPKFRFVMFGSPPPVGSALSMSGEYCRQICTSDSVIFYPSQLNQSVLSRKVQRSLRGYLKGTVPRDFCLQVLFKNHLLPDLWLASFNFFVKFVNIHIHDTALPIFFWDLHWSRWHRWTTKTTVAEYTLNCTNFL
jgi:hypothetical protein